MKIKSLYINAQEKESGLLFVSMGMMEILKRKLHRVAFFKPIIYSRSSLDKNIEFMLERYDLNISYDDCYVYDISEVEEFIFQHKENELFESLIARFKYLENNYDFILCQGVNNSFFENIVSYDLNLKIAQNFSSSYINIILAKNKTQKEIYESIMIERERVESYKCNHFATFVNRVSTKDLSSLKTLTNNTVVPVYLLDEIKELSLPTLEDLIETVKTKNIVMNKHDHLRTIRGVKVAALSIENFLEHIEEGDLIIVPADRSDIILGIYGALNSNNYPKISAILFPFDMKVHPNIEKLITGLDGLKVPILSVEYDTFTTANKVVSLKANLRVDAKRKIALALGLFYESVDLQYMEKRINSMYSHIMTPQMFEYKIFAQAHKHKKNILFLESDDERILRATEIILRRGIAKITLLGDEKNIIQHSLKLGLKLDGVDIINHLDSKYMNEFVDKFYDKRKNKGLSYAQAKEAMLDSNYFATMMVDCGYVDGLVSGAMHSTADTIRPALQILDKQKGVSTVSSMFFICLATEVLVYADCAINEDPNAEELADIAIASAFTAKTFDIEPKVAMLSYSSGKSGSGIKVDKVRRATEIVRKRSSNLPTEGPIQYDAAVSKKVAQIKLPNSEVAGEATVFIFPDLNTSNNTYKAVQRSSGAIAIGPIVQGFVKPVNDLSRGCSVEDIVTTVAITAIQAEQKI